MLPGYTGWRSSALGYALRFNSAQWTVQDESPDRPRAAELRRPAGGWRSTGGAPAASTRRGPRLLAARIEALAGGLLGRDRGHHTRGSGARAERRAGARPAERAAGDDDHPQAPGAPDDAPVLPARAGTVAVVATVETPTDDPASSRPSSAAPTTSSTRWSTREVNGLARIAAPRGPSCSPGGDLGALVAGAAAGNGAGTAATGGAAPVRRPCPSPGRSGAEANEPIHFSLVLRLPGPAGSSRRSTRSRIRARPSSGRRSRRAIRARYGLAPGRWAALRRGCSPRPGSPSRPASQRTVLGASAPAGVVQRLLGVGSSADRDRAGRMLAAGHAGGEPRPGTARPDPAWRADVREAITGSTTRPHLVAHDVPLGGLIPPSTAAARTTSPRSTPPETTGTASGSRSCRSPPTTPADPAAYAQRTTASADPARRTWRSMAAPPTASGQIEANLDIDVIRSVAPAAQIVVYEAPQILRRIRRRHQRRSSPPGSTEHHLLELGASASSGSTAGSGDRRGRRALAAAVLRRGLDVRRLRGQGAYDCQSEDLTDLRRSVDWPASSCERDRGRWHPAGRVGRGSYTGRDSVGGPALRRRQWRRPGTRRPTARVAADPGCAQRWPDRPSAGARRVRRRRPGHPVGVHPPPAARRHRRRHERARPLLGGQRWCSSASMRRGTAWPGSGFVDPALYALAAGRPPYPPFHDVTRGDRH